MIRKVYSGRTVTQEVKEAMDLAERFSNREGGPKLKQMTEPIVLDLVDRQLQEADSLIARYNKTGPLSPKRDRDYMKMDRKRVREIRGRVLDRVPLLTKFKWFWISCDRLDRERGYERYGKYIW